MGNRIAIGKWREHCKNVIKYGTIKLEKRKSRIMVNRKKYENLILYICDRLGGAVDGKKKLAKLLYFVDFDRYEYSESMKTISGDTYKALQMGPVPKRYMEIIKSLVDSNKLELSHRDVGFGYNQQEVFTAKTQPDESCFDSDDKKIIDRVIRRYGGLNGKQLEILTHQEAPWLATDPQETIAYELAFYRGTDFSDVVAVA